MNNENQDIIQKTNEKDPSLKEGLAATPQKTETSGTEPGFLSRHKALMIFCIVIVIVLPLSGYGIYTYNEMKAQEHQENLDLAVLCEENYNIEDYQHFLKKYPESTHFKEVETRMHTLNEMAASWDIIKDSQKQEDFVNFKQQYSDTHYNRLCDVKLDSIDWSSARKLNTPDGYQAYISKNPNGLYVSEAIIAKGEVGYMNLTENEVNNIREVCTHFFNAINVNNLDSTSLLLASEIDEFMELKSPAPIEVMQWMEERKNNAVLGTYVIKDSIVSQRSFSEEKGISYISQVSLEKVTSGSNGEEKKEPLIAVVKQNRRFQIYSFEVKTYN